MYLETIVFCVIYKVIISFTQIVQVVALLLKSLITTPNTKCLVSLLFASRITSAVTFIYFFPAPRNLILDCIFLYSFEVNRPWESITISKSLEILLLSFFLHFVFISIFFTYTCICHVIIFWSKPWKSVLCAYVCLLFNFSYMYLIKLLF